MLLLFLLTTLPWGTFSIVATDLETGELGVAVASRVPDVGYIVPWIKPGVGAVATQAYSNPFFGPRALQLLANGLHVDEVMDSLIELDTIPEMRQVGIVDKHGNAVAFTGKQTLAWSGHIEKIGVTVQGNILTGPEVLDSMLAVFEETGGLLAERLLSALEAGERAGGDKRGKQSAALYVMLPEGGYLGVDARLVDLKVLDNSEPVSELRRLFELWQYVFIVPAYLRLADKQDDKTSLFLDRTFILLKNALRDSIDKAEILNMLAWEFAVRKAFPEHALQAALRAQALAPESAYILDTVAEAYYANGKIEQAIFWEKKALEIEPENEFYESQLNKFEKALRD